MLATERVSPGSKSAKRIAVITLPSRNHPVTLRFAQFQEVLAREFQRRLDGLGAAGNKIGVTDAFGRPPYQLGGEHLHRRIGEKRGVRKR